MKKILVLFMLLIVLFTTSCSDTTVNKDLKEEDINLINNYIDDLMNDSSKHIASWNKEGFKGRLSYIDGVFLQSLINLYENKNDDKYIKFVDNYVKYYIDKDGNYLTLNKDGSIKEGVVGFNKELDSLCTSYVLFDLYDYTKDIRYKNAIEYSFDNLMSQGKIYHDNDEYFNFEHKPSYQQQVWLDGMFMYAPFLARYAKNLEGFKNIVVNNKLIQVDSNYLFNLITSQFMFIKDNMKDVNTGLYYHGFSADTNLPTSFWADKTTKCSKSFWARSTGWLLMGLLNSILYFEDGNNKTLLINMLNEAVESLLKYKDSNTSMFYDLLDKKDIEVNIDYSYFEEGKDERYNNSLDIDTNGDGILDSKVYKNYLETSSSSMFAYTLIKGALNKILDSKYYQEGLDIFEGVRNYSLKIDGNNIILDNIHITAGLGGNTNVNSNYYKQTGNIYKLYRDGTASYYLAEKVGTNDAKGVGPFIMAYVLYLK